MALFTGLNTYLFKRKAYLLLFLFSVLLCCTTCKDEDEGEKFSEGYIEYDITYLENLMEKNVPTNLLPKKMTLKFRDNMSLRHTEGFMGLFSLTMITDHKKHISTTLIKVLGKKYYYEGEKNEPNICFEDIPGMKIEMKKGTKVVSGLKCKRGHIIYPGEREPSTFYYTENIQLKDPNFANPYRDIDGVLVEFEMKLHKLIMKLTATEIYTNEVSNNEFTIPSDFKRVSKSNMMEILSTLLE
jgi:hypothetical protein